MYYYSQIELLTPLLTFGFYFRFSYLCTDNAGKPYLLSKIQHKVTG